MALGRYKEISKKIKEEWNSEVKLTLGSWEKLYESINEVQKIILQSKKNSKNIVKKTERKKKKKEQENITELYFKSEDAEYIYYLIELKGEMQLEKLKVTKNCFTNKRSAKLWRDKIARIIHPDVCEHEHSKKACEALDTLYKEMLGEK